MERVALPCFARMLQAYKQENWGFTDTTEYQRRGNAAQISKSHRTLGSLFAAITLSQASRKTKTNNPTNKNKTKTEQTNKTTHTSHYYH